ncbi:porin [Roseomonas sp. KE0001]|uniref:porin n=1 Tax=Roseomonas sp. KE0001 TaxID=2479201 RepID=UPI0018DF7A38|nr:porin [Roseomonas sp. KE0001]MBI0434736.1 porin [Roseomonas sp. KE0001]
MRKILLATTAVAAAAVFGPAPVAAQEAPTVRVGGYFRFNYSFTDQDLSSGVNNGVSTGKSDFASDTEVHVIVAGKAANGLTYGATVELQVDMSNNSNSASDNLAAQSKTGVDTDEMYMWVATPQLGQLRMGDEDGVLGGLMNSGHITNFGTGGMDGDWFDSVIGAPRATTMHPGDIGDNTKIIYMSPQFFGFDFGGSFAFNTGEGEDVGCAGTLPNASCDRFTSGPGALRRRNEYQVAARYRGSFSGVGMSITGGYIGSEVAKNTTGLSGDNISVGVVGAQFTAYGLLVGGWYNWGSSNGGWNPLAKGQVDGRDMTSWFAGASYTFSGLTIGANTYDLRTAGSQSVAAGRVDRGWSVGASYALAPGLALVAEYNQVRRKENGFNFATGAAGTDNNAVDANIVIVGTRIAF